MTLLINKETGVTTTHNTNRQLMDKLELLGFSDESIKDVVRSSKSSIGEYIVSRQSYPLMVVTDVNSIFPSEVFTTARQVINYFKTVDPLSTEQEDMLDDCIWFNHGKWLITFTTM